MRGKVTEEAQKIANKYLKRDITQVELRLYPYLDFCIKNMNCYDRRKMSCEELDILEQLHDEGHVFYTVHKLFCTRNFYDYLQEILAETYIEEWY